MPEIVPPGVNVNFIGRWKVAVALSVAVLVIAAAGAFARGVRFGIDFAGGTEVHVRLPASVSGEGAVRNVVTASGVEDPSVVRFGPASANEFLIRFASEELEIDGAVPPGAGGAGAEPASGTGEPPAGAEGAGEAAPAAGPDGAGSDWVDRLENSLAAEFGSVELLSVDFVGPRVGAELRRDGLMALTYACILILIYIGFRFTARFAPGAVLALLHDVLVTAGIWVLLGEEFNLQVLAALLAILGYSLNDTIILYDRIRENMELRTTTDLPEVLNRSVNQTLSRTILTSGTTLLAVLALVFLGGEVIRPFALAMTIGIVVGTYSSIYVAAPTLLVIERRLGAAH